jgi:hypothetical protein
MSLRRFAPLALASAVLGCQADIPNQAPPNTIVFATSFPSCSDATQTFPPPFPNDLALRALTAPTPPQCTPVAPLPSLTLLAFLGNAVAAKGFPPAGVPNPAPPPVLVPAIAIHFREVQVSSDPSCGPNFLPLPATTVGAPDLDVTTVTASTLAVVRYDTATPTQVPFTVVGYDKTTGILTVVNGQGATTGSPWETSRIGGRYVVAVRGGANGVKTKSGQVIAAQNATFLISQGKDLTKFENQSILRACITDPNDPMQAAVLSATVNQLTQLQSFYANPIYWTVPPGTTVWTPVPPGTPGFPTLPTSPFAAVDTVFPHSEIATIQTFAIAPTP